MFQKNCRKMTLFTFFCVLVGSLVAHSSSDSIPQIEVSALVAFKKAIRHDPFSVLSDWDADGQKKPCNWTGIYCSMGHVTTLNISNSLLKGSITDELRNLTSLRKLILHNNSLIGAIPKGIGMIFSLRVLDLSVNKLSGPIPRNIGRLSNVKQIYLQSNGLTGAIPLEFSFLTNLTELRLDRNKLQGVIPGGGSVALSMPNKHTEFHPIPNERGFCKLPLLKSLDLSYNFLVGRIPVCLKHLQLHRFQGNCFKAKDARLQRAKELCRNKSHNQVHHIRKPQQRHVPVSKGHDSSRPTWLLALEVTTGICTLLLLVIALFASAKRCRKKPSAIIPWRKTGNMDDELVLSKDAELLKDVVRISRQDLEVACEDFSNIIGTSADNVLYKGTLKDEGQEIAVISLGISKECWTNHLELYFQNEVADLARLTHENMAKLLGYCRENNPFTRMLVFEYASNGTLYEHLHYGEESQLTWSRRMRIILGIARALKYLHCDLQPPFPVSFLSSTAIYLTEDFSPKLVDFDKWKSMLPMKDQEVVCGRGAFCALPDIESHDAGVQENTFAFGVLLLEIISGKHSYSKDIGSLVDWAREYLELPEALPYLVDSQLSHFRYDDLLVICEVINLCILMDPVRRPSMQLIYDTLERGIDISPVTSLNDSSLAWAELALAS